MRLKRFALPVILVSAILLLGGVTVAFVAAKSQPPTAAAVSPAEAAPASASRLETVPEPAAKSQPPTAAVVSPAEAAPAPAEAAPSPIPLVKPAMEPALKSSSGSGAKSVSDATSGESSPPVSQAEGPTEDAEGEVAGQGTVYTWQDGDRTRRIVLQARPSVRETVADAAEDGVIKGDGVTKNDGVTKKDNVIKNDGVIKKEQLDSIVREQSQRGNGDQPVFRSESGGGLMTLPGGIVLALDPQWDRDTVESFFLRNGIALERTSELDFLDNGFFVETEPGFPSLELANTLAGQDGVILSSPNWAREVESK